MMVKSSQPKIKTIIENLNKSFKKLLFQIRLESKSNFLWNSSQSKYKSKTNCKIKLKLSLNFDPKLIQINFWLVILDHTWPSVATLMQVMFVQTVSKINSNQICCNFHYLLPSKFTLRLLVAYLLYVIMNSKNRFFPYFKTPKFVEKFVSRLSLERLFFLFQGISYMCKFTMKTQSS